MVKNYKYYFTAHTLHTQPSIYNAILPATKRWTLKLQEIKGSFERSANRQTSGMEWMFPLWDYFKGQCSLLLQYGILEQLVA